MQKYKSGKRAEDRDHKRKERKTEGEKRQTREWHQHLYATTTTTTTMLTIAFYGDWPHLVLPQDSDQTVEDILVAAARVLGISPLCRHLFGLRNCSNRLWVRADFLAGEIPELIKHPEDGLGLVVTDVLLHLLNNPGRKVGDGFTRISVQVAVLPSSGVT
ncbi:hypothetical protein E2C01_011122 [Portunus trituberculatus]|uniref:Uncharacterized protein n=1 Tax=Portunus trituberculatus TaxID=210409 RepID=A0A5B7DA74_PORTR|nr:hypothetical protein [Portunus trituberculatus]